MSERRAKISELERSIKQRAFIGMGIFLMVVIYFINVRNFDFTNYDDPHYVTENQYVNTGLSAENIKWAVMSTGDTGMWHPLTFCSHQLDVSLFGIDAGMHHLINVVWHALGAVFLFLVVARLSGSLWMGAVITIVWALHPEKVQSVAWISERKDVLSGALFFMSIYGYLRWWETEGEKKMFYVFSLLCFALSLLAKPSVVALPLVLFVLFQYRGDLRNTIFNAKNWRALGLFILMSIGAAVVTIHFKQQGELSEVFQGIPLYQKAIHILNSYTFYIERLFWPQPAKIWFSPAADGVTLMKSTLIIVAMLCIVLKFRHKSRLIYTGLALYTLLWIPISGIVTVSYYYVADRYSYLPQIGLIVLFAGVVKCLYRSQDRVWKQSVLILTGGYIGLMLILTQIHLPYWKNSRSLFEHELAVNPHSLLAPVHLAKIYEQSEPEVALRYLEIAHKNDPEAGLPLTSIGVIYFNQGEKEAALRYFEKGRVVASPVLENWNWLLRTQIELGEVEQVKLTIADALSKQPRNFLILKNAGVFYTGSLADPRSGLEYFLRAHKIDPLDKEVIEGCIYCYENLDENSLSLEFKRKLMNLNR